MDLVFYKLHCLTEDYILINTNSNPDLPPDCFPYAAAAICKRRTGPGASGVIYLRISGKEAGIDFYLPDGGHGGLRSNAVFCASRYLFDSGLVGTDTFSLNFSGSPITVDIIDSANFRVSLGTPVNPATGSELVFNPTADYTVPLMVEGKQIMVSPVRLANTFLVHLTDSLKSSRLSDLTDAMKEANSKKSSVHPVFVFIQNREECRIRFVYRGPGGFDFAGACAAGGVAGVMNGLSERELVIQFRNETVFFQWLESDNRVYITAAPRYVYSGDYDFNESVTGCSI